VTSRKEIGCEAHFVLYFRLLTDGGWLRFVQAADIGAYAAFQQYALTLSVTTAKVWGRIARWKCL
jgi:hypothetical protein